MILVATCLQSFDSFPTKPLEIIFPKIGKVSLESPNNYLCANHGMQKNDKNHSN